MSTSRSAGSIGGAVVNSRDKNEAATIAMQMQSGLFNEHGSRAEHIWGKNLMDSLALNLPHMVPAANDSNVLTYDKDHE